MQIVAGAGTLEEESSESSGRAARSVLKDLLLPRYFTREYVSRLLKRAIRNGSWRFLSPFQRSLLLVCSRICRRVRSEALYNALSEIAIDIELHSTRGRALYYGVLVLLKKASPIKRILEVAYRNIEHLLYQGLSYLNNPPVFRVIG